MKIKVSLVFFMLVILTACGKTDEDYLNEGITEKISYINTNDVKVYFNSTHLNEFEKINSYQSFNQLDEVNLSDQYTFIGFNVEEKLPTVSDIEHLKEILNQNEKVFSACFFGTKDFNYLEPLLEDQKVISYENVNTFALCFANFQDGTTQYDLNVRGYKFEDIVDNPLLYQNNMLNYIEKQIKKYYEFIG